MYRTSLLACLRLHSSLLPSLLLGFCFTIKVLIVTDIRVFGLCFLLCPQPGPLKFALALCREVPYSLGHL